MRGLVAAILVLFAVPARAATIEVGPTREIKLPSTAVAKAQPGDTIAIDAGEYFDCFRVTTPRLTIEGVGGEAVLTDKPCDGKAIVVDAAADLVLRNLVLTRVRVPDQNGAGIRAEGGSLTVEHVRFVNDQAGILGGDLGAARIIVRDSQFVDVGRCDNGRCVSPVSIGRVALLRIERSRIGGTAGGHQVVSSADRTELAGVVVEDGPQGRSSFQVVQAGGSLTMEDCVVEKGPHTQNLRGAVLLDGEMTGPLVFRRNHFIDDTGHGVPFVLDWSSGSPVLEGNVISKDSAEISSSGYLLHRAAATARAAKQELHDLASLAKQIVKAALGRR